MGVVGQFIDDSLVWAKKIAVAGFGENANIVKNLKVLPDLLPDQAVRTDLLGAAKSVINNARAAGEFSDDAATALRTALKDELKDLSGDARLAKEVDIYAKKADELISAAGGSEGIYKTAIDKYNSKRTLFNSLSKGDNGFITQSEAERYFGRDKSGIGIQNMAKGIIGNNELRREAAIGYAGAAVGARVLSGGSLTTNNRGERDIAGIPFI